MKGQLEPAIRDSFQASREIQEMHNHPMYCFGKWIHEKTGLFPNCGEVLYVICSPARLWRELTCRD